MDLKTGGGSSDRYLKKAFDEKSKSRLEAYEWLIRNSWLFGFIRTVRKEEWHFDYKPEDAVNGPYAKLSAKDLGKVTTKFYNKTKQGTIKGLDKLTAPDWGATVELIDPEEEAQIEAAALSETQIAEGLAAAGIDLDNFDEEDDIIIENV